MLGSKTDAGTASDHLNSMSQRTAMSPAVPSISMRTGNWFCTSTHNRPTPLASLPFSVGGSCHFDPFDFDAVDDGAAQFLGRARQETLDILGGVFVLLGHLAAAPAATAILDHFFSAGMTIVIVSASGGTYQEMTWPSPPMSMRKPYCSER